MNKESKSRQRVMFGKEPSIYKKNSTVLAQKAGVIIFSFQKSTFFFSWSLIGKKRDWGFRGKLKR